MAATSVTLNSILSDQQFIYVKFHELDEDSSCEHVVMMVIIPIRYAKPAGIRETFDSITLTDSRQEIDTGKFPGPL